jgi:hypothetical protein
LCVGYVSELRGKKKVLQLPGRVAAAHPAIKRDCMLLMSFDERPGENLSGRLADK